MEAPSSNKMLVLSGSDLKSNPDTRKILVAAAYGQIPLQQAASAPELRSSLAPVIAASTWTLSYGDNLRIHNVDTALRLLGRLASPLQSSSPLYGASELEKAQVDGWLSFFWSSVDLPIQAMLQAPQQQQEEKNGSQTRDSTVELEFRSALSNIDLHLLFRTYLVGNAITVADIALAISVEMALHAKLWVPPPPPSSLEHNVSDGGVFGLNLMRHYETLKNQAWFKNGGKTLTPSPALMAAGGAGVLLNGPAPAVVNKMYRRNRIRVKEVIANDGTAYIDQSISVAGWARTVRKASSKLLFIELNDGSCSESLQCVVDANDCVEGFEGCKTSGGTGASFAFTGQLIASKGTGQAVELQVTSAKLLGAVYAGNVEGTTIGGGFYPLSKKEHTLEHSRDVAHLRPRTAVHAAAMRIRHCMAYATHNFFHNHGFLYIHTPIITGADCEGAGEQFGVTGLLGNDHLKPDIALPVHPPPKEPTEDSEKQPISKSEQKRLAKQQKKKGTGAAAAESNKPLEEEVVVGAVDYTKDFFGQRVNLTVSGQLNVETHACALSDVYTFGPTFRAEYSFTSRHLSEFWMIEPEIAFADLTDDINLAEDYLKYCVQFALENCAPDLEFFENSPHGEAGLRARLRNVLENPFKRLTYTEAIEILQKAVGGGVEFEEKPVWGMDLPSEMERYICEKVFQQPVVLTDYPKEIKAFYMKLNDDGKTVAAADILVPKIGEIIGGSQREHRLDVLTERCVESGLDPRAVWWYLDLRRYGTIPHAGFGLGFERLILFITGLSNIRDVIPFPRWAGNAKF